MKTIPKLSDLTDEQRHHFAAEALGWRREETESDERGRPGEKRFVWNHSNNEQYEEWELPNPDKDADDALLLVEHLRKHGWLIRLDNGLDSTWEATFWVLDQAGRDALDEHYAPAATLPRAITSAFLLASNLAEQ